MSRSKLLCAMVFVMAFAISQVSADFVKTKWEYNKAIRGQASSKLSYMSLDRETLLNSAPGYADLRIIDGDGKETPYKLIESTGEAEVESIRPTATNVSVVPGKYSSVTLNLGKHIRSNRLLIDTPDQNFTCRVEVAGMDGNGPWEVLRSDAYIFDFSRDKNAKSAEVTYPESDYSILRVRIFACGGRVIKANGATVIWKRPTPRKSVVLFSGKGSISEDTKNHATKILLKLPGSNLPGGTVRILSSTPNYQRQVGVFGSRDGKNWESIGDGYLLKYNAGKFNGNVSNIGFGSGEYNHVKLLIYNGDDQPISIDEVTLETPQRQLAFMPKTGMNYKLFYGNHNASVPDYDIQSLYGYLSTATSKTLQLTLGQQERNSDFVKVVVTKPWLESNQWVIWAAMGAAMVVLLAFVINLARQIKTGTPSS